MNLCRDMDDVLVANLDEEVGDDQWWHSYFEKVTLIRLLITCI